MREIYDLQHFHAHQTMMSDFLPCAWDIVIREASTPILIEIFHHKIK